MESGTERRFNLIKTDFEELQTRVFPRFPVGQLLYKSHDGAGHTFEVKDISLTGMQLFLKDGNVEQKNNETMKGQIHWKNLKLDIEGTVQWIKGPRLGIKFKDSPDFQKKIAEFLSVKNIIQHMRPVHQVQGVLDIPGDLKFWLRSDGVMDLYVWEHANRGISRFQMLCLEHFVEWIEGEGLHTGRVLTQRNLDTPLALEDEFVFQIDQNISAQKVTLARDIVDKISDQALSSDAKEFLLYKLNV